jgi:hypothetical protein
MINCWDQNSYLPYFTHPGALVLTTSYKIDLTEKLKAMVFFVITKKLLSCRIITHLCFYGSNEFHKSTLSAYIPY